MELLLRLFFGKFFQVKENLLSVLEDKKEDSEIRIAAYLGVMRCPGSQSLLRVQNLLANEDHDQGKILKFYQFITQIVR